MNSGVDSLDRSFEPDFWTLYTSSMQNIYQAYYSLPVRHSYTQLTNLSFLPLYLPLWILQCFPYILAFA